MDVVVKDDEMKELLKQALIELIQDKRELLSEALLEAIEEAGLLRAIREGRQGDLVSEEQVRIVLRDQA